MEKCALTPFHSVPKYFTSKEPRAFYKGRDDYPNRCVSAKQEEKCSMLTDILKIMF